MISARAATAIWIDANGAVIERWSGGARGPAQRLVSEVPTHHKSTGHVGEPGGERHGGTGPRSAQEGHRQEHLRTFIAQVAAVLPAEDDLLLLGDGTVVEHLARHLAGLSISKPRTRRVELMHSGPLTEGQMVARLRSFAGDPAPRQIPRRPG